MITTKTEFLKTFRREISKDHVEYDMTGRPYKIYVAPSSAVPGDVCLVKEFLYHGITTIVKGRMEGYTTWQAGFDTDPDFLTDDLSNLLTDSLSNHLTEN